MNQEALGTMGIPKLLFKMAVPLIVAQLVNGLYSIVDRIYLGHIGVNGSLILTGVGICYPIIIIITAFSQLIGNGGGPRAAISMGQRNRDAACEIVSNCAALSLIFSLVIFSLFFSLKAPLLRLFGASDNTFPYANEYIGTYLFGTPFVLLTLGLNPFISAQGRTGRSMATVIIGAVMNIILDPIFIFVLGMGPRGAALATVISQCCSALYVVITLVNKESSIRLTRLSLKRKVLFPIIALGISPFIMVSTEAAIQFVFNTRLLSLGGDIAVGTMTIFISFLNFVNMPINGLNQAVSPVVSYNFGSKNNERVMETFKLVTVVALIYTATVSLFSTTLPQVIVGIFTSSEDLSSFAPLYARYFFTGFAIFGLQVAAQNTFLGLGQAGFSIFFALFRKILLLIPLVYILSATSLSIKGVFLSESIADATSAIVSFITFILIHKRILKKGPPVSPV